MKKLSLDKMKNKGTATAAATIAAAGLLVGGSFEAPADILKEDAALAPTPIIETLNAGVAANDSGLFPTLNKNSIVKNVAFRNASVTGSSGLISAIRDFRPSS